MNAKVLLVDDDPAALGFLAAALERFRCAVTTATSAEAALDLLERDRFDRGPPRLPPAITFR